MENYLEKREKQLGFKPQTEVVFNSNLPYADHIDSESNHALSTIKTNLARAVLNRELRPGVTYWASQLTRYIRLYGLKFSKEDHVLFIKLFYQVLLIPELESLLVEQVCNVMGKLLKKRELLCRTDLQLDWEPLYKLSERICYSKMEPMGLEWIPSTIDQKIRTVIRHCRSYFPPESTQSMLDEWRPLLCPFDIVMGKAVKYLDIFLPTLVFNDTEREVSWKIWIEEFLVLWLSVQNGPSWEKNFINLFARLAHNNIGCIDWNNYVNPLFTRLLRSFNLPVGKLQHTTPLTNQIPLETSCLWIVSMMGGPLTKKILEKLKCLLKATETYFHPSNLGKHSTNLSYFIQYITTKFLNRIHRERYKRRRWEPNIPKDYFIQDEDIEEFVEIMKPVTLLSLYGKIGSLGAGKVLQGLAYLRADLILPSLLDKTYIALETLTEPHQVRSCLSALSSCIVPGICNFPESRKHVIPLLFHCLPALDPNDLPKSTTAFQFISTCFSAIPITDCSAAVQFHDDLSESDKELCFMTSQFEDFVLQYLDRCFVLLEALNRHNENYNRENSEDNSLKVTQSEGLSGMLLVTATGILLQQASKPIYKLCIEKLFHFVTTHVLEGHVAMSTTATLISVSIKANPSEGFALFLPHYCNAVLNYFAENEDTKNFERIDSQLIWDLKILSEICHTGTEHTLEYKDLLCEIAQYGIQMLAKEAYEPALKIIKYCIRGWTLFYTYDRKIVPQDLNQNSSDTLAIHYWGVSTTPWNLKIDWHVPSEKEFEAAFEVLDQFLEPSLQKISDFSKNEIDLTKEELRKALFVIKQLMKVSYLLLPLDTSDTVKLDDDVAFPLRSWPVHVVETLPFYQTVLSKHNRKGIRARVFNVTRNLLQKMLLAHEDDVESVNSVIEIYSHCFQMHEELKTQFDQHWKVYAGYKIAMKNPLEGNKQRDRFSHVDRTVLQQQMRILAVERSFYTTMHHHVMLDLIDLSISHYMQVRSKAQSLFFIGLGLVPSVAYKVYLPLILKNLAKENGIEHKKFKGALYLLLGKTKNRLFLGCYQKWDALESVWPALINAPHSDKPSITKLYEKLAIKIQAHFVSVAIICQISAGAEQAAIELLKSQSFPLAGKVDSTQVSKDGMQMLVKRNKLNLESYNRLIDLLIDLYESGELSWRNSELALGMLSILLRYDVEIPVRLCKLFVSLLVDDAVSVRTLALACIGSIMKAQKRLHVFEMHLPQEIAQFSANKTEMCSGDRDDNLWHQYNSNDLPCTKEKFEQKMFIDKTHWGYYTWPKKLKVYSSFEEQPKLNRSKEELSLGEVPIYEHLTDTGFVEKVVEYLCLENEKGKDKFDEKRMDMFRGLFRNFGDTFVPFFKPHIMRLVKDKRESHQRCAAEIITGLVMGSKLWTFEMLISLWDWLIPALRIALSNICVETLKDWDTAFNHMVQNRDPRRIHWLMNFLIHEPMQPSTSALIEASKLYVLQGGMHQQEWRIPELLQKVLEYLEPILGHPYKNIRSRIGSLIASIFLYDVQLLGKPQNVQRTPSIDGFITKVMSRLESLLQEDTPPLSNASSEFTVGEFSHSSTNSEILEETSVGISIANGASLSEMEVLSPELIEQIQNELKKVLPPGSPMPEITSLSEIHDHVPANLLSMFAMSKTSSVDGVRTPVEESISSQVDSDANRSETIRMFKTLMKWIVSAQRTNLQPFRLSFLQLLPLICKMYPVDQQGVDEELHRDSRLSLSCLAQSLIKDNDIMKVIETIDNIATHSSWHARHTVLSYIQVFAYTNLFSVCDNEAAIDALQKIILRSLRDDQCEVSQMASVTLSGLIQCGIIHLDEKLLTVAYDLSNTKLKPKKRKDVSMTQSQDVTYQSRLMKRHSGILILSAFVLSAPYTVPEWMPRVVMCLSDHLHDPQPIHGTIKKTLSDFRRTHHDNWHVDKQKFTSDELAILTDLLVSPNYYA